MLEEEVRATSERFFADAEAIEADRLIDGVDAVVVLGENFLVQRAELLEIEFQQAAEAEAAEDADDGADFDVSDVDPDIDADDETEPGGTDAPVDTADRDSTDPDSTDAAAASDTVPDDG